MSVIGSKVAYLNIPSQQFAGGTNVYVMSQQVANVNSILVSIDGIKQFSTAYTVDNFTLTFSEVVPVGSTVEVIYFSSRGIVNSVSDNTVTTSKLADANVTNLKLAPSSVGTVNIIDGSVNSIKLANGSVDLNKLASGIVNGPAVSVYQSTPQTITTSNSKVLFQTKLFDTNTNFSTATSRFTPNVPGYYSVNFGLQVVYSTVNSILLMLYKNGANVQYGSSFGASLNPISNGTKLIYMNGTTDYLEVWAYSANSATSSADQTLTYFQASMSRGV